jgi:hypothetical protein
MMTWRSGIEPGHGLPAGVVGVEDLAEEGPQRHRGREDPLPENATDTAGGLVDDIGGQAVGELQTRLIAER